MERQKMKRIVLIHGILLIWAVLFAACLFYFRDGSNTAGILAVGNIAFLLFNIPFSAASIISAARKRICRPYLTPIVIMSILNAFMGLNAWAFLILLMVESSYG